MITILVMRDHLLWGEGEGRVERRGSRVGRGEREWS